MMKCLITVAYTNDIEEKKVSKMMVVGCLKITLRASWVRSLKEKRMIVRSIVGKVRHKFNVSIHEVERMDEHQIVVIGISCVSNSKPLVQAILEQIVSYIESHYDTEIYEIEVDFV